MQSAISTLQGNVLIERHYKSLGDLARTLQGSRYTLPDNTVLWRRYGADDITLANSSSELEQDNGLSHLVDRLQGIIDPETQEVMATVQRLREALAGLCPKPKGIDVHRVRTQGRAGFKLNIHRVYAGRLDTAWTRMQREHQLNETGVVTIGLCLDYSSTATTQWAMLTQAATLALADIIESTGRRVELWGGILTYNAENMRRGYGALAPDLVPQCPARFTELDHIMIKHADGDVTSASMAALCSLGLLRDGFFQIWRMQHSVIGRLRNTGSATMKSDVLRHALPYFERQGIPAASILMGADQSDRLQTLDKAVAWMQHQIRQLS